MAEDCELIAKFMEIGVIKFGEYMMKKGSLTPIYVDLRAIVSYPEVVRVLSEKVWTLKGAAKVEADLVCGVPYTALPISASLSVSYDIPMVLKRKESKNYGTKKLVEGDFQKGEKCLIVEDVVSSGSCVIETAKVLRNEGLIVTDCIVIVNRQEGGQENLLHEGIALHTVFKLQDIMTTMLDMKLVSNDIVEKVQAYFNQAEFFNAKVKGKVVKLPFSKRAEKCTHPVLKKLYSIIDEKKTNLCVAVDVVKSTELFQLAEVIGPHICILKTHIDTLENFSDYVITSLIDIAKKYNFLILEDRKFADIGSTVQMQYKGGIYKIRDWADIITVHSIPGESIIEGLKPSNNTACFLIAQMSSKDALIDRNYINKTISIAHKHSDFVIGFISQSAISEETEFVHLCPGIHLEAKDDPLGQSYKSPEKAILVDKVDIIIVGRGITKAKNVKEAVEMYKSRAYEAYLKVMSDI